MARALEGAEFAALTSAVEDKLGKKLTTPDLASLLGLYDQLGLPSDVIFLLVGFCVERTVMQYGEGRRPTMRQIEKEGYVWARLGLMDQESASAYINKYLRSREALPRLMALLRLGVPVGIMNSITAMGIMLLQSVVNGLGSVTVAAYTAGSKLMNLALQPGDILGIAVGTYVGQNLGAGRLDRIRAGVRQSALLSLAINIVMGLVLALFGRELTAVFVSGTEEAVIEAAYPYFVITGAGVWIVGLLFLYRFALQSLGDPFIPMVSGGVELGMRVGAVLVLDRCFDMGFYAVCWAEVAAWLGAGVLLAAGYYARMARLSRQEQ